MNTVFMISGGAGRVVAAIPALEKYARLNPQDDFKVLIHGWESLYWGHPVLQTKTFSVGQKGAFDLFIKNNNLVVPEPYHCRSYYTQQKSLAEAFDEEINHTDDHTDLGKPSLYLQSQELNAVKHILENAKNTSGKDKIVVFQPYGSGIGITNGRPFDSSIRSLDVDDYLKVAKTISNHAVVVFFGPKELVHPGDDFSFKVHDMQPDLRMFMALISQCDYFIGCDSVGQHMARAFDKPGVVIMGSTFDKNVTYPDHFKIFRNGKTPVYNPIRIGGQDCDMADRANDSLMTFTTDQLKELAGIVIKDVTGKQSNLHELESAQERKTYISNEVNHVGLPKIW